MEWILPTKKKTSKPITDAKIVTWYTIQSIPIPIIDCMYGVLFEGVEDLIPKPKPRIRAPIIANLISGPPITSVVYHYIENEDIPAIQSTPLLPPSPIIFHEWFLYCIYSYFSLFEISRLSRVCKAWCKMGQKLVREAASTILYHIKQTPISPAALCYALGEVGKRAGQGAQPDTVELQIGLKNFDPYYDRRLNCTHICPYPVRYQTKIMCIGDEFTEFCHNYGAILVTSLYASSAKYNQRKYKKLAKSVDLVVTNAAIIRQIPRMFGPILNKVGRFPIAIKLEDVKNITNYMENIVLPKLERTVKLKIGKHYNINIPVGHVKLKPQELAQNIVSVMTTLANQLKKGWHTFGSVYIKSTRSQEQIVQLNRCKFSVSETGSRSMSRSRKPFCSMNYKPINNFYGNNCAIRVMRRGRGKGNKTRTKTYLNRSIKIK